MIHLDYRDARPIYQVIDGFREQILSGICRPVTGFPRSGSWPAN